MQLDATKRYWAQLNEIEGDRSQLNVIKGN